MKLETEVPQERIDKAQGYYDAVIEDLGVLKLLEEDGFRYPCDACMLMARSSEKLMKAKLLLRGNDVSWIHDQTALLIELGVSEEDPILATAAQLSVYAVKAAYPSDVRNSINTEVAKRSYEDLKELIGYISSLEPAFDDPM